MIRFRTRASSGAERSGVGKVKLPACFRFYGTEHVSRPTAFVFVVPFSDLAGADWKRWTQIAMQRDWLLIQANHGRNGIVRFLIDRQHVFHLAQVLGVQIGDAPHFFPATA
jgi:hypothetical protein